VLTEIRTFNPHEASEHDYVDYHAMLSTAKALDMPEDPPLTYEAAIGRLRTPPLTDGACSYWAARLDGHIVGMSRVALPQGENSGLVLLDVTVHPERRRQGIGLELLRVSMPAILSAGRGIVIGTPMKSDAAGVQSAVRLGFQETHRTVMQMLVVTDVRPERWDVAVPLGYHLERWIGMTPAHLLDSYAAARPAIADAPTGQTSYRDESGWTAELVRETERELAERGVEERVVVAVEDDTGKVAGLTGMLRYPHRLEFGYQNDTSVLPAHRGHGLGLAMKAAMMRWTTADWPELERGITATAADNTYMIDVNLALGYRTAREMVWVEITAAELTRALDALV
jgi:mycothiol synthase